MAAATAPGPRAPGGEGGGLTASALSMERIQSLTDLADLEAAYSRLCEEEVCGRRAREAAGPSAAIGYGGAGRGGPGGAGRGTPEAFAAPAPSGPLLWWQGERVPRCHGSPSRPDPFQRD